MCHMDCKRVREIIEDEAFGETAARKSAKPDITDHLKSCPQCEQYLTDLSLVTESFAMMDAPEPPADLVPSVMAALPDNPPWMQKPSLMSRLVSVKNNFDSFFTNLVPAAPKLAYASVLGLMVAAACLALVMTGQDAPKQGDVTPEDTQPQIIAEVPVKPATRALQWTQSRRKLTPGSEVVATRKTVKLKSGDHQILVRPASKLEVADNEIEFKRGEILARFAELDEPFTITARDYTIQVVGTELGIRSIPGTGLEVAVIKGKVEITAPGGSTCDLNAYQKALLTGRGISGPEAMVMGEETQWYQGRKQQERYTRIDRTDKPVGKPKSSTPTQKAPLEETAPEDFLDMIKDGR